MMVQWLARGWELVHSDQGTRLDVFFGYLLLISSLREGLEFDILFCYACYNRSFCNLAS
jgi:hypothetical protein